MIVGRSYEVAEDGSFIRLFGLQGSKLPQGTWKVEKWVRPTNLEPATSFEFEVKPVPAYAILERAFEHNAAAIADGLGLLTITHRIGVRLFLEGFLKPAHFEKADADKLGLFITLEAEIRGSRCAIIIVNEGLDIEGETNFVTYTEDE